jgi:hypothetical protein
MAPIVHIRVSICLYILAAVLLSMLSGGKLPLSVRRGESADSLPDSFLRLFQH